MRVMTIYRQLRRLLAGWITSGWPTIRELSARVVRVLPEDPFFIRRAARAIGVAKLTLAFAIRIAPALSQLTAFSPPFSLLLLFYKVVDCNAARICVDGQDLPPVADDHKIQVRIGCR